jgi:hypothetical protein
MSAASDNRRARAAHDAPPATPPTIKIRIALILPPPIFPLRFSAEIFRVRGKSVWFFSKPAKDKGLVRKLQIPFSAPRLKRQVSGRGDDRQVFLRVHHSLSQDKDHRMSSKNTQLKDVEPC